MTTPDSVEQPPVDTQGISGKYVVLGFFLFVLVVGGFFGASLYFASLETARRHEPAYRQEATGSVAKAVQAHPALLERVLPGTSVPSGDFALEGLDRGVLLARDRSGQNVIALWPPDGPQEEAQLKAWMENPHAPAPDLITVPVLDEGKPLP